MWISLVPPWDSLCFLDLNICFLPQAKGIFSHYFFKCIFCPFLALFSSGTPIMQTSGHLILPQRFLKSIFLFKIFSFLSPGGWFPVLSSWLLTHSSVASNLLLTPSVYFISCTAFFSSHWVFLYFLSLSLISHYVPPFFSWVQGAS